MGYGWYRARFEAKSGVCARFCWCLLLCMRVHVYVSVCVCVRARLPHVCVCGSFYIFVVVAFVCEMF